MKLKTLKDWWKALANKYTGSISITEDDIEELRQSAIEWVKHWLEVQENRKDSSFYNEFSKGLIQGRIDGIMVFVNLTEEHLK